MGICWPILTNLCQKSISTIPVTLPSHVIFLSYSLRIKFNHNNSSDKLKILYWNCRGVSGKIPEIQYLSQNFDVICLQEILLLPDKRLYINGY